MTHDLVAEIISTVSLFALNSCFISVSETDLFSLLLVVSLSAYGPEEAYRVTD